MKDNFDRSRYAREAWSSHKQFSLAANIDFQFWCPNEERGSSDSQAFWFQDEEPEPPEGWVADEGGWWQQDEATKCRIIYHRDEDRRLDDDQAGIVSLTIGR